jgi:hypothetical protein
MTFLWFFVLLLAWSDASCSDYQTCSACEADLACDFCSDAFGHSVCAERRACPALMMLPDPQCCAEEQFGSCSSTVGCVRCAASNACAPSLACTPCALLDEPSCDAAALCLWCNDQCQTSSDVCVHSEVVWPVVFSIIGVLLCVCGCLLNKRRTSQPAVVYVQPQPQPQSAYPGNVRHHHQNQTVPQITTTEYMTVAVMPVRITVSERTPLVVDSSTI